MAQQPAPQPEPASRPNPSAAPDVDLAFCLELEPGHDWQVPLCSQATAEATWISLLSHWLTALACDLPASLRAPAYSLGLHLVDDDAMAALNSTWRHHEGPTDVLAFPVQEDGPPLPAQLGSEGPGLPLELGDIVISLDTAARQAAEAGHSPHQELLFLASHGLLHLLGWDHPDEASLAAMLARQDDLLSNTAHLPLVAPDSRQGESPS